MEEFRDVENEGRQARCSNTSFLGSLAPLVSDLMEDLRELLQQELSLARAELREEGERAGRILLWSTLGVSLGAIAGALLVLACVFGLQSALPGAPLWACFGLIGSLLGLVAMALYLWGAARWHSVELVPQRTLQSLRESFSWLRR